MVEGVEWDEEGRVEEDEAEEERIPFMALEYVCDM